jgi:acetyl-CoA carboxylase biotin carboxyl carrier protein
MNIDLDKLRELIAMLEESSLTELEIKTEDERIRLSKAATGQVFAPSAAPYLASAASAGAPVGGKPEPAADEGTFVTSPFVGTFYRSPSPDSEPFVKVGDQVHVGQTLCIVEAMKLMNEIEAEIEGKIVEILVEDGKPVEFGDRLFRVES